MKRYTILIKIVLIVILSLTIAFLILKSLYFTSVMMSAILIVLAFSLYLDQRKTIRRMEHLIANIHYGDLNLSFPVPTSGGAEAELTRSMNEALNAFRSRLYNSVVAEAETEAWQKLIRVLTHEIMNSIAPIISLSETVTERAELNGMNERDYAIMLQAIQTIHRRSKGLLDFVENYRKLTRIPTPTMQIFPISVLFSDLQKLVPADGIHVVYSIRPAELRLYADRSMIEQVLINLLKNAMQAIESDKNTDKEGHINIHAYCNEAETILIEISNNGPAIPNDIAEHIFIPFFTTKEGGSGIGLSISRQIMRLSGGNLSLLPGKETTFILKFN